MAFRRPARRVAALVAAALTLALLPAVTDPPPAAAADTTALTDFYTANDASKGWVDLSQTDTSYLRAAQATRSSGLNLTNTNAYHGNPVGGWNSTSQSFSWQVDNTTAQAFAVDVLIANAAGTIAVSNGSQAVSRTYTTTDAGWNKVRYGNLTVPAGRSTITVRATAGSGLSMSLLSLELAPASRVAAIDAAAVAGRSTATWLRDRPTGVFYQWGQWGAYPDGTQPAWPKVYETANFDVLADRIRSMGAGYVVWSVTWTQFYVAAPIGAVDRVLAGRTSTTDHLQRMIDAFKSRGIKVMFYFHNGHDNNPNLDWWNAFWTTPAAGTWARKEAAIGRWLDIVTEMGQRYGTGLDGWMFYDGSTYYPAPAATVNAAVRAGNPDRLVSFNTGYTENGPRLTDYQDFSFGETNDGTKYPLDANGVITSGPFVEEQSFGNMRVDNGDWGVRTGDKTPITPAMTQTQMTKIAQRAYETNQSMAFDFRMWSDLTQSRDSVAYMTAANNAWQAEQSRVRTDDGASTVRYTGAWQNRNPGGCAAGTCHNAASTGAAAEFTFTGNAVTWYSITGSDQGQADVYVDGVLDRTVDLTASTRSVGVAVYSRSGLGSGSHTVRIVTKSTKWVTVDGFSVLPASTVQDGASTITYGGSWESSNPGGCSAGTCRNSKTAGSTAQLSFTGTQVTWNSITGPDQGQADIYLDGTLVRTVNLYNPVRTVGSAVHTTTGLSSGSHTLRIVTKSAAWVTVDDFSVVGG